MRCILTFSILLCCTLVYAQDRQTDSVVQVSGNLPQNINSTVSSLDKRLTRQSEKYLKDFEKQEKKLFALLAKTDSGAAAEMLASGKETYQKLANGLQQAGSKTERIFSGDYLPGLDSLQGALGFLKGAGNLVSKSKDIQQQLGNSLNQVNRLQNRLAEARNIQQIVGERQAAIQNLLGNYTNLPKEVSKYFGKYQQQAFYYSQQVHEYKEILNDPDKLTSKLLSTLQTLPVFQQFMSKYSMLAVLFPTPENAGTPAVLNGLQTRASVQQDLLQRLPAGGTGSGDPTQFLQDQMQQAQGELSKLKDKLDKLGVSEGNSSMAVPDFKPNSQKTKSFLQRLEFGSNFQTQRASYYFPVTTDIAFTVGYKFSDKAVAGIGVSGRMGWGSSWQKIQLTSQGIGFRSYIDWKAPDLFKTGSRFMASLWFTAGAELNYNRTVPDLSIFKNYSNWHKSALAGLTKKFSMNSPLKKGRKVQGNIQFLYDFLHTQSIPRTPAFVWRVGYGL